MSAVAFSLDAYPLAKCLDGSPARYYLRAGTDSTRWLIFHEGGGFCESEDDCRTRAKSRLGSTAHDNATLELDDRFYFSLNETESPFLATANHVFVRYCDGAYYSGDRAQQPVLSGADASPLYFRGRYITEAVFEDLSARHSLANASDVVLSGCSAGAIRVYAHLDSLRALLPPRVTVVGFADSGFYLDVPMFTPLKRFVTAPDGQNATALLSARCLRENPRAPERCLVAEASAAYLRTPLFGFQSRYDVDQRTCEMPPSCALSAPCVEAYGTNATRAMRRWLGASTVAHGAFMDGCSRHCDGGLRSVDPLRMQVDSVTPLRAFAVWRASLGRASEEGVASARRVWFQPGSYPCGACCGGAEVVEA